MAPLYTTRETFANTALSTTTSQVHFSKDSSPPICSICTEPCTSYSPDAIHCALRLPSCAHIFGAVCIETWFDKSSTCPLCRTDFFPMKPEEISPEMAELPCLLNETFQLLHKMQKMYPQGRQAVGRVALMLGEFGNVVARDCEERTRRREGRLEEERAREREEQRRQDELDAENVAVSNETEAAPSSENTPSGPSPLTAPNTTQQDSPTPTQLSILQETKTFLAHDFSHDFAALRRNGEVNAASDFFKVMNDAEDLIARAENAGLWDAARAVGKRCTSVSNATTSESRQWRVHQVRREELARQKATVPVGNGAKKEKKRGILEWCSRRVGERVGPVMKRRSHRTRSGL